MRRVVVSGLGVVSPIGNETEEFYNNLINGVCGIGHITRFDASGYKAKCVAEVKNYDPSKYMPKSEVRRSDPYALFGVGAVSQAMEDCGDLDVAPERLGVYFGSGIGGINTFHNEYKKMLEKGPEVVSPYFITMMISNIAAGQIAIKYGARGPSLPVVTACASSTNAIGEAYRAIKHGYADAIIAGGSEASITPMAVAGFINCMALTLEENPALACVPFDKRRSGFVMGEGAGALVLEEYEHAKRRGAKIYAEVKGYGNTCDAHHITAPRPDAEGATAAMRLAAEEAGILNEKSIYINAHGTSTDMNDRSETKAIKDLFGKAAYGMYVSSTKSMTGHCLGAAGAIEAAATVLALSRGVLPPTIGYKEPDPDCDLNYIPNKAVKADVKAAMSNSFGFGGHNASVCFTKVD